MDFQFYDGGDMIFCLVMMWLCLVSMTILGTSEETSPRRNSNRPVVVGGGDCGCGACAYGSGVCDTYLSY
jgi:hypothetical protein